MLPEFYTVHPSNKDEGEELLKYFKSLGSIDDEKDDPTIYHHIYGEPQYFALIVEDNQIKKSYKNICGWSKWWWEKYHPKFVILSMAEFRKLQNDG